MALFSSRSLLSVAVVLLVVILYEVKGKKLHAGTNYEVDEDDIVSYTELGQSCDPAVQHDNRRKTGRCRATLICNPDTRLCDCEDIGGYKYTAVNGKCKNYIGSDCYAGSGNRQGNCVDGAECVEGKCTCVRGKSCITKKLPVKATQ